MANLVRKQTNLFEGAAEPLRGLPSDYDALLEAIGEARFVLIGEASHGTHDFYKHRAEITKRILLRSLGAIEKKQGLGLKK